MANTSYYQSTVVDHYLRSAGSLVSLGAPHAEPLVFQQDDDSQLLQGTAILVAAWALSICMPKPQRTSHFKTRLVEWISAIDIVVHMLSWLMSVRNISVDGFAGFLPTLSGSIVCQTLQLIRLTTMVWVIRHFFDSPSSPLYGHEEKRKMSKSLHKQSQLETNFLLDFISKTIDKLIVFAVLLASIMLLFGSVLFLALQSTHRFFKNSSYYNGAVHHIKHFVSVLPVSSHQLSSKF
ncbi:unnamed protein product [Meganyctiphanes norvegica]|uniref:Uncharacterized protein n=1 Tax=Meganyctiphanes norvegica TaxID=48144 RepID=A0AAV2QAZ7_MEGNR